MKLDELRTVQSKERRKDSLQQLRDSFYEDVAAYLQDLTASRDRRAAQVDNPFSDTEVRRLSDELETAEEVAEAVYERRVGKVVKLASFAAADMPVDDEGMTSEERRLFEDLVDRIEQNKRSVLDVLSGTAESSDTANATPIETPATRSTESEPTPPPSPTDRLDDSEPAADSPTGSTDGSESTDDGLLADAMGGSASTADTPTETASHPDQSVTPGAEAAAEPPAAGAGETAATDPSPAEIPPPEAEQQADAVVEPSTDGGTATQQPPSPSEAGDEPASPTGSDSSSTESADDERTTLRITKNVGEIFGVDGREYTLRSEDVVTLPTTNAEPLVERDAAMRLD